MLHYVYRSLLLAAGCALAILALCFCIRPQDVLLAAPPSVPIQQPGIPEIRLTGHMTASYSPTSVELPADGVSTQPVVFTVYNDGAPLQGITVTFKPNLAPAEPQVDVVTNLAGRAVYTVPARSALTSGLLKVLILGQEIDIDIKYVEPFGKPKFILLAKSKTFVPADGQTTVVLTATVYDDHFRPVPDQPVFITPTHGLLEQSTGISNKQGIFTTTLTAPNSRAEGLVRASTGTISTSTIILFGYSRRNFDGLELSQSHTNQQPINPESIFTRINVFVPAGVVTTPYVLKYLEVLTPVNQLGAHNLTSLLDFELRLIDRNIQNELTLQKPITIEFSFNITKALALGLNPLTMGIQRILSDGNATGDGISVDVDLTKNKLIVYLSHLSRFQIKAGSGATYLPLTRRT